MTNTNGMLASACRSLNSRTKKQKGKGGDCRGAEQKEETMFISRAPGLFPKCQFDTMLVNMIPRARLTQRAQQIKNFTSFDFGDPIYRVNLYS